MSEIANSLKTSIKTTILTAEPTASPLLSCSLSPTPSRRAQAPKDVSANRPNSTRAAGAGGSSNTMLRIYTDDNKGLSV